MIAPAKTLRPKSPPDWHEKFVSMLPTIRQNSQHRFRHRPYEEREELVAEDVALAFVMFVRLVECGKAELGYATPLANYTRPSAGERWLSS